ncbi:MAG: TIR domain-containing protein [Bacteroidales bacterium]|nr:TIR domain-containing protein [Bacteroidales bacterium]
MEQNNCEVFISYTRADYVDTDRNVIPGNAISLIKEAFDKAGITYWFDEEGIYAGDPFAAAIVKGIYNCDVFVYISSERSNSSRWTSNEIAIAFAQRKKIIPFRLDDSDYNESVVLYIQNLDHIDYPCNPAKAITRLVTSVTEYLTRQREIRAEKERKEKEEQERLRIAKEKEQAELASEIELSARELNTDEGKVQDKRRRITKDVQKIEDSEIRDQLLELIDKSGPIHLAHMQERENLTSRIKSMSEQIHSLRHKIDSLNDEGAARQPEVDKLRRELFEAEDSLCEASSKVKWRTWSLLATVIILAVALITMGLMHSEVQILESLNAHKEAAIARLDSTIAQRDSTIADYEKWIRKESIKLAYTGYRGYGSYLELTYTLRKDTPLNISELKLDILVEYPGGIKKTYWRFHPHDSEEEILIDFSKTFSKIREQTNVSSYMKDILITISFEGKQLVKFRCEVDPHNRFHHIS